MMMKNKIFKTMNIAFCVLILSSQIIIAQGIIPSPPIIQPGAPGEPSKKLDAKAATDIANTSYIKADVKFLQGMIVHHEQAIIMSEMANERTNNKIILDLAKRIDVSQKDEINFMESWLKQRNEYADSSHSDHHMHESHHMHMNMAGMATPKQLNDLSNSKSTDFDRLFLQLTVSNTHLTLPTNREV